MDPILLYGLGLLFYTTLKTAEDYRLVSRFSQLLYPRTIGGKPLIVHNGTNRNRVTD